MPRNGSGTYSLYTPGNPVVTGTTISSTWANNSLNDIATALTNSIAKDGQTTPTANLPMGSFKLTGLGAGSALTDSLNLGQAQDEAYQYLATVAGTNTITATTAPATTAYTAGQTYKFVAANTNTGAVTININSLGAKAITKNGSTALSAGDIIQNAVYQIVYDGTQFQAMLSVPADGAVTQTQLSAALRKQFNDTQDFRLTLTSGSPVTTSDVTGATTIYCCPYKGNTIALYDGTNWNLRTSAQFSLALGTLTSALPYDVFCYDNSGTPTLEFTAWTDDTNRATALTYQDGVLVKTGALTRRYIGTFYTTSTTQTEDSKANRYLWNYYHRVLATMERYEDTNTWTYTTATIRQANGSALNQLNYVCGVAEDAVEANIGVAASNSALCSLAVGVGVDSTTAFSGLFPVHNVNVANTNCTLNASYKGIPGIGRHYLAWLEYSQATGTTTWRGDNGAPTITQSGITGTIWK